MTGPEKETLAQALELQRAVLVSLDSFRGDIMHELRDFRDAIRREIILLDSRLTEVEESAVAQTAKAVGVAETVDALSDESANRAVARRDWVRVIVSGMGIGATAASLGWAIFEFMSR